jgi:hypothetical protein
MAILPPSIHRSPRRGHPVLVLVAILLGVSLAFMCLHQPSQTPQVRSKPSLAPMPSRRGPVPSTTAVFAASLNVPTNTGYAGGYSENTMVRQAIREVTDNGPSYAVNAAVRLPWRNANQPFPQTVGQWKCNFFVLNVVYLAGGRVPVVVYGSDMRRIVSNFMFWQGKPLTRQQRRDVSESHYPCSGDLANPTLFTKTLPVVRGGLEALHKGDLVILHPPEGEREGHCLIYLGHRQGTLLQVACASEDGAAVKPYDVDGERGYTIRRPQGPP